MKSVKLKFIILFVLMIVSAYSVKNVGIYGNNYILVAENYVIKLPRSLSDLATLNNDYVLALVPLISIGGQSYSVSPIITEAAISEEKNKFVFEIEKTEGEIKISERIEFREDYIQSSVSITNEGIRDANIGISYSVESKEMGTVFSPSAHKKAHQNYLVYTKKELEGNSLGLAFGQSVGLYEETEFENTSSYSFGAYTSNLGPGKSLSAEVKFYPIYIKNVSGSLYSLGLGSFTDELLIEYEGEAVLTEEIAVTTDKIQRLLSIINDEEKAVKGEFESIKSVSLAGAKNSLGMSMYFKDLCKQVDLPCKTVIGKKGEKYYAWITAYFGGWVDIDPFKGTKERPVGYSIIYEQPELDYVVLYPAETMGASFYNATAWLKDIGGTYFLLYTIITIVVGISLLVFMQVKAKFITKKLGLRKRRMLLKTEASGKYQIIKQDIEDPFLKEILNQIDKKGGIVKLEEIAEESHYSKELVSFAVTYLHDAGFINKIGEFEKKTEELIQAKEEKAEAKYSKRKIITVLLIAVASIAVILILLLY